MDTPVPRYHHVEKWRVGTIARQLHIHHYAVERVLRQEGLPGIGKTQHSIIDYLSYSNRHADLLFELVNRRYETKSTIVTTNRPFAEWPEVFPNAACVVSLVDRLVHHSEVIAIEGESYRLKEAKECAERKTRQPRKKS